MNITPNTTAGMTPQEKDIFFAHQEKRHREEREYLDARKHEMQVYRKSLIDEILSGANPFNLTAEDLERKSTRALEATAGY